MQEPLCKEIQGPCGDKIYTLHFCTEQYTRYYIAGGPKITPQLFDYASTAGEIIYIFMIKQSSSE